MWRRVCRTEAVESGKALLIRVRGQSIALFNAEGAYFALKDACPHRGGPLSEGAVEGRRVICPWHAWDFELDSGRCAQDSATNQVVYKLKVERGEIFLDL